MMRILGVLPRIAALASVAFLLSAPALLAQSGQMPGSRGGLGGASSLQRPHQFIGGGARVYSQCAMGGGALPVASCIPPSGSTVTIDPGLGPIQFLENNAAFTLGAPQAPYEGSILLYIVNGSSAGAVSFSNFTVGSSTGSSLTTTNGNKFTVSLWNVAPGGVEGAAGYTIFAHQ